MLQAPLKNSILSRLSADDFQLLAPHLEPIDLPVFKFLERRGKVINTIYFPESGFVSVVADGKRPVEVGLIGREGMTGLPVVLGHDRNANDVYVQASGHGHGLRANELRKAIEESGALHQALLRYVHSFLEQTTLTAVANARLSIEERLARWLLMADDRIDGPELRLTHELLAMMLAVRRPGVTEALQKLERASTIAAKRGCIVILDRAALEQMAVGVYVSLD
jgi:CRP-like cAMP-binding protein